MKTEEKLKYALSERFKEHLANDRFIESIQGYLPADEVSRQRAQKIRENMQLIAKI